MTNLLVGTFSCALVKLKANNVVSIEQILTAVPSLKLGQPQPLGKVVEQLHNEKLLGKNATSTKFFKKFPERFELTPAVQPNQVRYVHRVTGIWK
jgi:hypothetical protein